MDYLSEKFVDCSFSRFGFIMWTNRQTRRHTPRHTYRQTQNGNANRGKRFTAATIVSVSNYANHSQ